MRQFSNSSDVQQDCTGNISQYLEVQQQQQAISLLQNLQSFSGTSTIDGLKAPRFEQWIRNFESILDIAKWDETRKVRLLASKLTSLAAEALDDFTQSRTGSVGYAAVTKHLMERFHGNETREMYVKECKTCRRQPSETVSDYACRLK